MTASSSTTALSVQGLSKHFENGTQALKAMDLSIKLGERVSLLGPSGCGKSTTLRLIAGLDQPSTGTIEDTPAYQALSFVFQEATLLPWATVAQNVAKPLVLKGLNKTDCKAQVEDILERVELLEFKEAYPYELSGGMKMRTSIARALVTRPRLLLMDEPFAALDEMSRFRLNDMLLEQQRRDQFTLLFVTHSVFESVYLSNRVAIMSPRPGRIVRQIETPFDHQTHTTSDYRTSPEYINLCRSVSQALRQAESA